MSNRRRSQGDRLGSLRAVPGDHQERGRTWLLSFPDGSSSRSVAAGFWVCMWDPSSGASPRWRRRPSRAARSIHRRHCQVRDAAAHTAGDAQGGDDQAPRAARTPTTTRSRCGSSRSRFCRRVSPPTTVWGYGAVRSASTNGLLLHNAPSLTIEAKANRPVRVKWINELKDAERQLPAAPAPVDPTLHWANPPGGTAERDTRPTFTATPGPYTGPVPIVTHVHGAVGVGDESDGYAEAWYLPDRLDKHPCRATLTAAPGTTSSGARLRRATAQPGARASRPSSIRTRTAPRPSGITTTRSA